MKRFIIAVSCSFCLLFPALAAFGQSGPVKMMANSMSAPKQATIGTQVFTPERAVQLLQGKGAQTEVKHSEANGTKLVTITASLEQSDFKYTFNVIFATPKNGTTLWWYTSVLNTNANSLPANKLHGLLKENNVMAGDAAFMINPQGTLMLNSRSYAGIATDQHIHNDLTRFMRDIKETSNLWYTGQ
jgi:hypothetical protein